MMRTFEGRGLLFSLVLVVTAKSALALDLYYDFEGDTTRATDKLTDDGAQHGTFFNGVKIETEEVPFGEQASRFTAPQAPAARELYSTIEIPGTMDLGTEWTMAAFVDFTNTGFTRLFSSFKGTGAIEPNRMILDFDPAGNSIDFIRVIIGDDRAQAVSMPEGLSEPGYKHFALTYDNGEIAVYLNGEEVEMTNNFFAGGDVFSPVNVRFGEDPHDGGGTANEQFLGNVDDLVVIGRALTANEVLAIVDTGVADTIVPAEGELAIYYDFEAPDSGTTITDRFDADGAQNGIVHNNVKIDTDESHAHPLFGEQSARIGAVMPEQLFSTIEIPDTMDLGVEWTMAAHVDFTNTGFTRLFSSYKGTGAIEENRMIFDMDPSGGAINYLRVIVGPERAEVLSAPEGLSEPGYKHLALTYDNGEIAVYLNGVELEMSTNLFVGGDVFSPVNIRFGEDPHDGGGTANEQFRGNVDDLLLLGRALSSGEIAAIADSGVAGNVEPAEGELAVYYDFEAPDSGTTITDRFDADGAQNGIAHNNVRIDPTSAHPLFGEQSARLGDKDEATVPFSIIEVGPVGNLGSSFTMAAVVNMPGGGHASGGLARLFSTFSGSGSPAGRIVFDCDPNASVQGIGIRLLLPDGTALIHGGTFSVNEDHHIAATYQDGEVSLYLDGELVGSQASVEAGDVDLGDFPLRIGEDLDGALNENFIGVMDEVLVLSRALDAAEIRDIAENGFGAPVAGTPFRRGDVDNSGGGNITDAIAVLNHLFGGEARPVCWEAADTNGDSDVNIADPVFHLNYLFGGGDAPPDPGPDNCGPDPDPEASLGCEEYTSC